MSAPANNSLEFTVDFAENDQRTMTLADIVSAYNAGYVTAETYVWSEGMAEWTPLGQVPSIVSALSNAAAPAASPAANTFNTAAQASAARATTKGASRDLFGKVAHAGSEEDVTAAPTGYEAQPTTATTGVRNESSVLFSLAALTATTKSKAVPTPSASVTSALDDSGLIDLKALASQASSPAAEAPAPLGAAPLGLAPLGGLGAPLGGMPFGGGASPSPLTAADLAPPPKNKTGLFIGGGIAVAAIIVALAIALRPAPPAPAAAESLPLPKPTPTQKAEEPRPTPSPETAAKPPPTGTEEPTTAPKKAPPKYSGISRPGKKKTEGSGSGSEPAPKPAAPKPAGGGHCGCAPTDLPCNMRCSAKGG
jgi:hypothetical protein